MGLRQVVTLSESSRQLLNQCMKLIDSQDVIQDSFTDDFEQLLYWLEGEAAVHLNIDELIQATLHAELLKNLLESLDGFEEPTEPLEKKPSVENRMKFILLAVGGTLLAACEGFDGITSLMSAFPIPALAVLLVGILFSILSVLFFYGFSLVSISRDLGIKLLDAPKLFNQYSLQMQHIKAIRKLVRSYKLAHLSAEELDDFCRVMSMLQTRLQGIFDVNGQFESILNNKAIRILDKVSSVIASVLFFGSGYFAGQSVMIFILGFFMSGVTPVFWPVILFSAIVGLAAFALYWNTERTEIKKLIGSCMGLDEDNMLSAMDCSKEEQHLIDLNEDLQITKKLVDNINRLSQNPADSKDKPLEVEQTSETLVELRDSPREKNRYRFLSNQVTDGHHSDPEEYTGAHYGSPFRN